MFHDGEKHSRVVKTITLTGSDLEAVTDLLARLLAVSGADQCSPGISGADPRSRRNLIERARVILRSRQRRTEILNKSMFGEPAWDMLLALYGDHDDGPRQSVGRLSAASGSPPTTALRWLDYLEKEQLVARKPNPTDRRSDFVELTEKGRSAMERYLSDTLENPE